jgi:uncharacterized protein DUF4410
MKPTKCSIRSLLALTVILTGAMAGCATNVVQPEQEASVTNLPPPSVVLVYKFAVNVDEVKGNQGLFQRVYDATQSTTQDQRATEIGQQVADSLADELVKQINDLGLPAQRATRETFVPQNALVITGHFLDVDEGNRARRLVIGFGAGAAKVDTAMRSTAAARRRSSIA